MVGDHGEASHDAYACGDEKDGHVFQQEAGDKVNLCSLQHSRYKQSEQQRHAYDVAGYAKGNGCCYGIADVADANEEGELDNELSCGFCGVAGAVSAGSCSVAGTLFARFCGRVRRFFFFV